ncbi:MAG: hypothetical protein RLZ98_727 [Pseudomonadota bacterium]
MTRHLVLVPGLLCSADLFSAQVPALRDQVDLQIADTRRTSSIGAMADALLSVAPPRFSIAGLSMGGYVVFEVLRRAPERIERIALIDTNARADTPEQAMRRRELVAISRTEGLRKVQGMLLPFLLGPDAMQNSFLVERVLAMAEAFTADEFAAQQEAIIARPDNRPFLHQVGCPTLIIVGREDRLTPVKVAAEMAEGIAGSRLEIIDDCGHLSSMEQPETVNRLLASWLSDHV